MFQAPRGTQDILPEDQAYWRYVEDKAAEMCRLYGFERIETPMFEDTGLFIKGTGQTTDIVQKEMYSFKDKGDHDITLKPEGTPPVCRAYLEHGMHNLPQPVKLYYFTPIFRYERPQGGRFRQHHQFGVEVIGEADPIMDAEVIDLACKFFASLGLGGTKIKLNSIGDKACRPNYVAKLKEYYAGHFEELCTDCKARLERNPLRLLDCKQESCQKLADNASKSVDYLCPECLAHFESVKKYLGLLKIPYEVDHRLVRGLDYYSRTVFEVQPEIEGGQSTLAGGGRYDNLMEELGGKPTPALGFGSGIERMVLNLKRQGVQVPPLAKPEVFVAHMGDAAREMAVQLTDVLRQNGVGVIMAAGKSFKSQMRQANTLGAKQTLVLGDNEVQTRTVSVRDMVSSQQTCVPLAELGEALTGVKDKTTLKTALTGLK